ncbi:hypothetical protein AAE02nite_04430 [Adhaeribacter aerolatus]|uniref:SH3b domain-containing protein n=1 Tax=Adhaeribacter aerolatus TaxID=670289 RepID=A0A512ASU8_9BACT|nr:SH3 domain-containing protein [Adhaeribacter aerolatus]GEO02779.1 hypothetical protein AAE02nite_04430 [Adhaeribacter aerolatus]
MKKIILTLALAAQTAFGFADGHQVVTASARYENSKMYRQPGTSTEVLKALKSADEIVVVRRYNQSWTIVTVNGQVGYVLTAELAKPAKPATQQVIAKK